MQTLRAPPNSVDVETQVTLGLLEAVHTKSTHTQRSLAQELGIALGLTNAYLRRCVKKGYIKVRQAPAKRFAYYLTPKGFSEKSRLAAVYLTISFNFFRHARTHCEEVFQQCERNGWRRVALLGVGDLGEIALLCARDHDIDVTHAVDLQNESASETFAGLPVHRSLDTLATIDAAIITDFKTPQQTFEAAAEVMPTGRILTPTLLKVTRAATERVNGK